MARACWVVHRLTCSGLAVMMGTVWLRLETKQEDIQPFINAIVSPDLQGAVDAV